MVINGKNYLLVERRGCEYVGKDAPVDDVGNYRLYIHEFKTKETDERTKGGFYSFEVSRWQGKDRACIRSYHTDESGQCWGDCVLDRRIESNKTYCTADILQAMNEIAAEPFDGIKWVETFDTVKPAKLNWTPRQLIHEWATDHRLTESQTHFFEQTVDLYTGTYTFLCYQIENRAHDPQHVKVFLERVDA